MKCEMISFEKRIQHSSNDSSHDSLAHIDHSGFNQDDFNNHDLLTTVELTTKDVADFTRCYMESIETRA